MSGGSLTANFGLTLAADTTSPGNGIVNLTGGNLNADSVTVANNVAGGGGTFNLDGGTLGANAVTIDGTNGSFNWGGGTLTVFSNLAEGGADQSNPGFQEVYVGTTLDVTNGGTLSTGAGSTLDLGGLFINSGTRFNQFNVSGDLDLSSGTDTLNFAANPYLLRPNIGQAEDFGSLTLVDVAGTLTGTFDSITGVTTDLIGWNEFTGAFTGAEFLPVNSYYFEETANGVIFHYKVEGSVPEPGTVGLLALGLLVLRRVRRLKEEAALKQQMALSASPDRSLESALEFDSRPALPDFYE